MSAPGPALNAHFKAKGDEIRVISGAADGGAAAGGEAGWPKVALGFSRQENRYPADGGILRISACRAWLKANGYKVTQTGGEVLVIPTANPDQLGVFQSGAVDAVWTVEPWVTRLENDADARVFLKIRTASPPGWFRASSS
jgi:NitT/TauT family transport system substrate-binding protein